MSPTLPPSDAQAEQIGLVERLELTRIGSEEFTGRPHGVPGARLFGGHLVGQLLDATQKSVDPERLVHSLHMYYLAPGSTTEPIHYRVARLREGRASSVLQVTARQDGSDLAVLHASLARHRPMAGHQIPVSEVPEPESLPNLLDRRAQGGDTDGFITDGSPQWHTARVPADIRFVDSQDFTGTGQRRFWLRAAGPLDPAAALHQRLLAYFSDYSLISAVFGARGQLADRAAYTIASLDHALWFHQIPRVDDWLLCIQDSPASSYGRGLSRALFYDQSGTLIASTAQEGLVRPSV